MAFLHYIFRICVFLVFLLLVYYSLLFFCPFFSVCLLSLFLFLSLSLSLSLSFSFYPLLMWLYLAHPIHHTTHTTTWLCVEFLRGSSTVAPDSPAATGRGRGGSDSTLEGTRTSGSKLSTSVRRAAGVTKRDGRLHRRGQMFGIAFFLTFLAIQVGLFLSADLTLSNIFNKISAMSQPTIVLLTELQVYHHAAVADTILGQLTNQTELHVRAFSARGFFDAKLSAANSFAPQIVLDASETLLELNHFLAEVEEETFHHYGSTFILEADAHEAYVGIQETLRELQASVLDDELASIERAMRTANFLAWTAGCFMACKLVLAFFFITVISRRLMNARNVIIAFLVCLYLIMGIDFEGMSSGLVLQNEAKKFARNNHSVLSALPQLGTLTWELYRGLAYEVLRFNEGDSADYVGDPRELAPAIEAAFEEVQKRVVEVSGQELTDYVEVGYQAVVERGEALDDPAVVSNRGDALSILLDEEFMTVFEAFRTAFPMVNAEYEADVLESLQRPTVQANEMINYTGAYGAVAAITTVGMCLALPSFVVMAFYDCMCCRKAPKEVLANTKMKASRSSTNKIDKDSKSKHKSSSGLELTQPYSPTRENGAHSQEDSGAVAPLAGTAVVQGPSPVVEIDSASDNDEESAGDV